MSIGEHLKKLMLSKSVSAKEVSKATRIASSTLSEYLSNTKTPGVKALVALADFFEVSTDEIIRGKKITHVTEETVINESLLIKNLLEGPMTGLVPVLSGTYRVTLNIEKVVEIHKKPGGIK